MKKKKNGFKINIISSFFSYFYFTSTYKTTYHYYKKYILYIYCYDIIMNAYVISYIK